MRDVHDPTTVTPISHDADPSISVAATPRSWLRTYAGQPAWRRPASLRSPTRIDQRCVRRGSRRARQCRCRRAVRQVRRRSEAPRSAPRPGHRRRPHLPTLERCSSLCAGRHGVHQTFRNLDRAGIAWMIATPSASSTTPISNSSPLEDGRMNIVTSASSVSKPRQWCRSAWSMSSSETPCLRALASMSTTSCYASNDQSSTFVDDWLRPRGAEQRREPSVCLRRRPCGAAR